MVRNIVQQGKAFRTLVGIHPYGTDQSSSDVFNQPGPLRSTMTVAAIQEGGKSVSGQMGLVGGVVGPQTGTITVASNVFTATAEILLGDHRLLANIDFLVGAFADDTAAALSAAINLLPGFSASVLLNIVTVRYECGSAADVDFKPRHYGAVVNFTMSPTGGLLTKGSPQVVAPLMT